jgi:hypothetical protein
MDALLLNPFIMAGLGVGFSLLIIGVFAIFYRWYINRP